MKNNMFWGQVKIILHFYDKRWCVCVGVGGTKTMFEDVSTSKSLVTVLAGYTNK